MRTMVDSQAGESVPLLDERNCIACGADWQPVGIVEVPDFDKAGASRRGDLGIPLDAFRYARCGHCRSLVAIDGRRDPATLRRVYSELRPEYWNELNSQERFAVKLDHLLTGCTGADLWDVGCGDGSLLIAMSSRWRKHGIEPGVLAAQQAQEQGLDVVASTPAHLNLRQVADVVTMIDVIEHLATPGEELRACYNMLRPGGCIAVFTGSADALTARLAGKLWYYLHCPGHVCIFSRPALLQSLSNCGFVDVQTLAIEHDGAVGPYRWLRRVAGNAVRCVLGRRPAPMLYYRDHQLVIARRPYDSAQER